MDWPTFIYMSTFCFIGSLCGLVGGLILLWKENVARKLSFFFVSFAAGALLGASFFHLLPEALERGGSATWFTVIAAIIFFSITERTLVWHIHHKEHAEYHPKVKSLGPMLILGDSIHNFTDGIIIATTTLVSIPLGLLTALAVFLHEVPQEIGDFGAMLYAGYSRNKVIFYNVISALATFLGAYTIAGFASWLQPYFYILIAFAAGGFIYVAATDLMPELRHEAQKWQQVLLQTAVMIIGVVLIVLASNVLHIH